MEYILILILGLWVLSQNNKISELSQKVRGLEEGLVKTKGKKPESTAAASKQIVVEKSTEGLESKGAYNFASKNKEYKTNQEMNHSQEKKQSVSLESLLLNRILPVVGVLSVLLGVVYAVSFGYNNGYIGPGTLLSLAMLVSASAIMGGLFLKKHFQPAYQFVVAAGVLGAGATLYSSFALYEYLTNTEGFIALSILLLITFAIAHFYSARMLSALAAAGTALVPVLSASGDPNYTVLMIYTTIMLLVGAGITLTKGWRETVIITFISLIGYGMYIFDAFGTVSPIEYLLWLYGNLGVLFVAIVTRSIFSSYEKSEQEGVGRAMQSANIVTLLLSTLVVNILGYLTFLENSWQYFGFFVLAQGLIMFTVSLLLRAKEPLYADIFMTGALTSLIFATVFELGFEDNTFFASVVLFVEAIALYYLSAKKELSQDLYRAFGIITLTLGVISIVGLEDFLMQSIAVLLALVALLFAARAEYLRDVESVLRNVYLVVAGLLFVIWNYSMLRDVLTPASEVFVPYIISLFVVLALCVLWLWRNTRYYLVAALGMSIVSALHFMIEMTGSGSSAYSLLGFVAVVFGVYAPLAFGYVTKEQDESSEEYAWIRLCGVVSLGILFSWFGFWYFPEPLSTLFMLFVGVVFLLIGLRSNHEHTRNVGLIIIGLIILKLYLLDVWDWPTSWKIAAFLPLGVALISLPFWHARLKK